MAADLPGGFVQWAVVACLATAVLTAVVRRIALRRNWLDVPNRRSSHVSATPRGGGVALVPVVLPAVALGVGAGGAPLWPGVVLVSAAAAAVAAIGLLDDFRPLSIPTRLAVQALAVAAGFAVIGGVPALDVGTLRIALGLPGQLLLGLGCIWFVNLFNFMDGIDGIAAAEAAFVGIAAAVLVRLAGGAAALALAWTVLGSASLGFLAWNWAPARIFMGDVGSGFLGFSIAMLLVASVHARTLSAWTAVVLVAPFLVDTTLTLLRRMARGERWYRPHRLHAYQWLARRWGSHARVTTLAILVNVLVIGPLALACQTHPARAPLIAAAVVVALSAILWRAGAGRPEDDTPGPAAANTGGRQEP
jgi:Fuc2NAc and GlcNAc transferase